MCVRKDENKLKRGLGWPVFLKKDIKREYYEVKAVNRQSEKGAKRLKKRQNSDKINADRQIKR